MCHVCDPSPAPLRTGSREPPAGGAPGPGDPAGLWPHLSGVRGHLSVHPLLPPPGPGDRSERPAGGAGLRLVVHGALTRQVIAWSDDVGPDVVARVRVVCTTHLTHLDDAGRALLVRLVQGASRRQEQLHLPAPSPPTTTVLRRLGLLASVDTGPDPCSPTGTDGRRPVP